MEDRAIAAEMRLFSIERAKEGVEGVSDQGLDLLAQHQHRRCLGRAEQHPEIGPLRVLQIFDRAKAQGEATHNGRERLWAHPHHRVGPEMVAASCRNMPHRSKRPSAATVVSEIARSGVETGAAMVRKGWPYRPSCRQRAASRVVILLGPAGPRGPGHEGRRPPVAHLPAEAAERHRMEVKGSCDLPVLQREHLGQLGDDDPFGAPVVTGVAGDEMSIEKDGAVIVAGGDLQTRQTGRDVREERGGELEHAIMPRNPRLVFVFKTFATVL